MADVSITQANVQRLEVINEFEESVAINDDKRNVVTAPRTPINLRVNSFDDSNRDGVPEGGVAGDDSKEQKTIKVTLGPQHFDLLKLIGEGAFGKVIVVRNKLDGFLYAMKVISKKVLRKKNNVQYMKSERDILTKIEHPFVVTLWYAFQSEQKLFLVMDFLAGGELFFHLRKRGLILEKEARFYFAEMILAIEFLHGVGVIHRDLKPENVLLRGNGHICITDFGLAKEIGDGLSARTLCGTSEYMAPEMLIRNGYGKGVDWWSLGALFFEMLTGNPPFTAKSQKDLDKKIITEKLVTPPFLTANAHSLLRGMLEKDVNKRLGASKGTMFQIGGVAALKQHAFFDGIDWQAVINLLYTPPIDLGMPEVITHNGDLSSLISKEDKLAVNTPVKTSTCEGQSEQHSGTFTPGNEEVGDSQKSGGGTPTGGSKTIHTSPATGANTSNSKQNGKTKSAAMSILEAMTSNFHEDFTLQPLSFSMVEDCLSAATSPGRSRATSGGGDDDFQGFEYMSKAMECTEEQFRKFEEELSTKLAKLEKKKLLKSKNEEKKAKIMEQEKKKKDEAAAIVLEAAQKKEAKLQRQQHRNMLAMKLSDAQDDLNKNKQQRMKLEEQAVEYAVNVDKLQKKLKNLRKKLREISDLEEKAKSSKLTSEQNDKIKRKQEIEDEIAEHDEMLDDMADDTSATGIAKVDEALESLEKVIDELSTEIKTFDAQEEAADSLPEISNLTISTTTVTTAATATIISNTTPANISSAATAPSTIAAASTTSSPSSISTPAALSPTTSPGKYIPPALRGISTKTPADAKSLVVDTSSTANSNTNLSKTNDDFTEVMACTNSPKSNGGGWASIVKGKVASPLSTVSNNPETGPTKPASNNSPAPTPGPPIVTTAPTPYTPAVTNVAERIEPNNDKQKATQQTPAPAECWETVTVTKKKGKK